MIDEHSALLTVREASRRARVCPWTIYASIRAGQLGCFRVGPARRAIRLSAAQIDEWLRDGVGGNANDLPPHVTSSKEDSR
jgi:excisionase family DNA binding protein